MNEEKIPVISFFSGGGFMDMGFVEAGFDVVWSNEVDPIFAQLYSEGMTTWKNARGGEGSFTISNIASIKDVQSKDILDAAFLQNKPDLFGVIGGPPCQDFSINGNLDGFQGDRGSLTDTFLYRVLELNPSFFVMENVKGLIRVKKNAKHFKELLEVMSEHYLIDYAVLNSIDYGVPQSRERVFVIGINRSRFNLEDIQLNINGGWFPFPTGGEYSGAIKKYKWPDAVEFGSIVNKPDEVPLGLCIAPYLIEGENKKKVSNAEEFFNLHVDGRFLKAIKEGETNRPSFKRLHRFKYSPTTCYGNNEVHLHPYEQRRLSVREALRIQGVADSYVLTTKNLLSKKFKMIGNGVPVPLAKVVASKLLGYIKGLDSKENGFLGK